jgi:hypothetical protein
MPISRDHRGVVAFSTPAMPESTVCSPMLKRAKGTALQKRAATARWPQVLRSRGRRWPAERARSRSTAVPRAQRAIVIWAGDRPWFRASLIHRKPEPQRRARVPIRIDDVSCGGMTSTVGQSVRKDK